MEKLLSTHVTTDLLSPIEFSSSDVSQAPIIVFSHLRFHSVTQRPQHILTRLSKSRKIIFVEEPIAFTQKNRGTAALDHVGNITILQPRISWEDLSNELEPVVFKEMKKQGMEHPILWFYSPMFVEMIGRISYSKIIYDCMDELSAFWGAPANLIANERKLIAYADAVFTGGKSLYESKKRLHSAVYCFPSSVDNAHFQKVHLTSTAIPSDIATIKPPVVGFYGVIDERMDLTLLDEVSRKRPEVSFVIIGPVVKIDEKKLPRRANIHYLGKKSYEELPSYLRAFDIAMMPFALNDATRFISPTKTLEFMAAGKPIISTPIHDVVRDYAHVVSVVSTVDEFSSAITAFLGETQTAKKRREKEQIAIIKRTSWDRTVFLMNTILSEDAPQEEVVLTPSLSYT